MADYHKLSTKKYVEKVQRAEAEAIRVQENKDAYYAFIQFSFALMVLGATMLAVYTMPNWLPSVGALLENAGILNG